MKWKVKRECCSKHFSTIEESTDEHGGAYAGRTEGVLSGMSLRPLVSAFQQTQVFRPYAVWHNSARYQAASISLGLISDILEYYQYILVYSDITRIMMGCKAPHEEVPLWTWPPQKLCSVFWVSDFSV